MLIAILFVTALGSINCRDWDQFTFDIDITCRITNKPTFWYSVVFYENDRAVHNEAITQVYEEEIPFGTHERHFSGQLEGDEEGSQGYGVSALFNHNCTEDGRTSKIERVFNQLCVLGTPCNMAYQIDLTDVWGLDFVDVEVK